MVLDFVAFAIVYFVAFHLATSFGVGSYSPLWLPSSVLLCALLKSRTEHWWLFISFGEPVARDVTGHWQIMTRQSQAAADMTRSGFGACLGFERKT